jgi:hypothetical protein
MQLSGQYDNVESTALAKEDRADNSDVPKIQRESIRTRRGRLHGMRVNIERTLAVGVSQELLNGFDIFSIRLQQGDEGVTGRMPADLLVNAICLRNRPDFTLHEIVRPKGLLSIGTGAPDRLIQAESLVGVGHDLPCRAHRVTRRRKPAHIVGDMWLADLNLGPPEAALLGVQRLLHQLGVLDVDPSTFGVVALDRILGPAGKTVKRQMGLRPRKSQRAESMAASAIDVSAPTVVE